MTKSESYDGPWTVIYRLPSEVTQHQEVTYDVPTTVATLEAQGFIIIDIIVGG